jgi:hypothetical protein
MRDNVDRLFEAARFWLRLVAPASQWQANTNGRLGSPITTFGVCETMKSECQLNLSHFR